MRIVPILFLTFSFYLTGCASNNGGYFENEFLALDPITDANRDRNFTQGNGWTWESGDTLPHHLLDWVDRERGLFKSADKGGSGNSVCLHQFNSTGIGVTAFTPGQIRQFRQLPDDAIDRPYASVVTFNGTKIRYCEEKRSKQKNRKVVWTESLNLGMLGVTITEDFQRWSHETLGTSNRLPNGWDTQISDGGEPTFLYSLERSVLRWRNNKETFKLFTDVGGKFGYYTYAYLGIGARWSPKRTLTDPIFNTVGGSDTTIGTMNALNKNIPERYIFAKATPVQLVAYNSLLQGQFKSDSNQYNLKASDIERNVWKISLGYSDTFTNWCRGAFWFIPFISGDKCTLFPTTVMTFAIHKRGPEYKSTEARAHTWGGIYFNYASTGGTGTGALDRL